MHLTAKDFLQNHKIAMIAETLKKDIIYVDKDTNLEYACKLLGKNNISSVPIVDPEQNKFIGMIDVVDIALFIAHAYDQKRHARMNQPLYIFNLTLRIIAI